MGLRFHKSINLGGGFRVNLSTKGIGYSWGVKGYRITKTADGRTRKTLSFPGTGISYVEEHKNRRSSVSSKSKRPPIDPMANYSNVEKITSANPESLRSPEYEQLFSQVKKLRILQAICIVLAILSIAIVPLFVLFVVLLIVVSIKGRCSIIYEFDDAEQERWNKISDAWRAVAKSKDLEEITLKARLKDARKNAGIKNSIDTAKMTSSKKLPWYIKTNVKPVVFNLQNQKIAILPDRLLVIGKKGFGALDYDSVDVAISAFGFLVTGPQPSDSVVVKTVWAYSNKDGSPDKRFSNNRKFPIMKYGKIVITSEAGLNVQFICSNESASDALNSVINTAPREES